MKAFLSHSSKDAGYVEEVASLLRPGTYELDSETFDRGLLNAQLIETALQRSNLFVLFLSEEAIASGYVNFEIFIAREMYARGSIKHILIICLDENSFAKAGDSLRFHNMVRKAGDSSSSARLISSLLISTSGEMNKTSHPFLNREKELSEIEEQLFDSSKPLIKALFISGNQGSGRRSLTKKVYSNHFPHVLNSFPDVEIDQYDGLDEIHRKILSRIRPNLKANELRAIATGFVAAQETEKARQIAALMNSLLPMREAMILIDVGGLLTDEGAIQRPFQLVMDQLEARPHPPLAIVASRMVPTRLRRPAGDIAYCATRSLSRDVSKRLLKALFKIRELVVDDVDMGYLVDLGELHAYNYYRISDEVAEKSIAVFLSRSNEFVDWKHRRSTEYLKRINIDDTDKEILSILNILPQLDFDTIFSASGMDSELLGASLQKLIYEHVIEHSADLYKISPALRVAVERDRRFAVSAERRRQILEEVAHTLTIRIEDGIAPLQLIDSAILAEIQSVAGPGVFAQALILPSHYVWLARRSYDRQDLGESIRLANLALEGAGRLSRNGKVAACRYLCLSAARTGNEDEFVRGIKMLKVDSQETWTKSNIEFLIGFNERLKGNLPAAEDQFRKALSYSPDNFSAARELAAVCANRGNLEDAESYARLARDHAPDNPYILDILISVIVRRHGSSNRHYDEIERLFESLEKVGEEGGRSFYTTRRAEYEHLWGDNKEALRLIDKAAKKTPHIFDVHRLRAIILLKSGDSKEAWKEISTLKEIVESRSINERRANYRLYIETYSEYLQQAGRYKEAKDIFIDNNAFTAKEIDENIKMIEVAQGYATRRF